MHKLNLKRYMKQIMLDEIDLLGQVNLREAKVAIIGAGGLGCPISLYLNAVGVGTLGIIDFDKVEESNLHRQVLFSPEDVGRKKVDVVIEKLKAQNPETRLLGHPVKLDKENVNDILSAYDVVVDGCDNFATRYLVNDACVQLGKPLIYGSILGFEGQLATFNYKGSKNLKDLFPTIPDAKDVPSCSENGVLGTLPGIMGTLMAQEVVKVILDLSPLQNEWVIFDTMRFEMKKLMF